MKRSLLIIVVVLIASDVFGVKPPGDDSDQVLDGFQFGHSREFKTLMKDVEKVFYRSKKRSPVKEARRDPVLLARYIGYALKRQARSVERYPDLRQKYNFLLFEARQYFNQFAKVLDYPFAGGIRVDGEYLFKQMNMALKNPLPQEIEREFGLSMRKISAVLESGPDVAGYDVDHFGDQKGASEGVELLDFVNKQPEKSETTQDFANRTGLTLVYADSEVVRPEPDGEDPGKSKKLVWAMVNRYVNYMLRMDMQGMKSLATGELLEILNELPPEEIQAPPKVEIKYGKVELQGDGAKMNVRIYNPNDGSLTNRLVFDFDLVKSNQGWKIRKVKVGPDRNNLSEGI